MCRPTPIRTGAIVDVQIELDKPVDVFAVEADRRMNYCDQCGISVLAKMHGIIGDGEMKWCFHCAGVNAVAFNEAGGFLYEIRTI